MVLPQTTWLIKVKVQESLQDRVVLTQNSCIRSFSSVVQMSRLDKGKTINHDSYIDETLKPLVKGINAQRSESGCKGLKFHHDNAIDIIHIETS